MLFKFSCYAIQLQFFVVNILRLFSWVYFLVYVSHMNKLKAINLLIRLPKDFCCRMLVFAKLIRLHNDHIFTWVLLETWKLQLDTISWRLQNPLDIKSINHEGKIEENSLEEEKNHILCDFWFWFTFNCYVIECRNRFINPKSSKSLESFRKINENSCSFFQKKINSRESQLFELT